MATITIGIVASSREWRSILQAHVRDHVADVKVQILREPRMALELPLDVVVIDDVSSFLTRDKVVRLREKGTRVVGIYDPEGHEGLGVSFLENLGVDLSLPSNISPEEMINAVSQLQPKENYSNVFDHAVADFSAGQNVNSNPGESTLIAVSGPAGTGSTEVAIALADILVARRNATLLLDCDEVGPSVARRLGFHLHPNILSAMDSVANVTRPLTEMVGRPSDQMASSINFDVIPGIASQEDWPQLKSTDLSDLFSAARKSWRYIICNTGPFAEDLSGYGMERFCGTRAALEYADLIVGVMTPTPTGYMRFLDWLASLRTIGHERSVYVVVNRSPKSGYIRSEIENQLSKDVDNRYIAGVFFVPEDERVSKAEWEGQLVQRGPFVNSVAELATYAIPMNYVKKTSQNFVGGNTQNASTGYSGAPLTPQTPSGYQTSESISWNDPDIVNPPSPPQNFDSSFATEQPQAYYASEPETTLNIENIEQIEEIETSVANTMQNAYDNSQPQHQEVNNSENYSFSPPLHAIEQIATPENTVPPIPTIPQNSDPIGQDYVPAYKREAGNDSAGTQNAFVTSQPNEQQHHQEYLAHQNNQNAESTGNGYVPKYVDNTDEEESEDKNDKFWGN